MNRSTDNAMETGYANGYIETGAMHLRSESTGGQRDVNETRRDGHRDSDAGESGLRSDTVLSDAGDTELLLSATTSATTTATANATMDASAEFRSGMYTLAIVLIRALAVMTFRLWVASLIVYVMFLMVRRMPIPMQQPYPANNAYTQSSGAASAPEAVRDGIHHPYKPNHGDTQTGLKSQGVPVSTPPQSQRQVMTGPNAPLLTSKGELLPRKMVIQFTVLNSRLQSGFNVVFRRRQHVMAIPALFGTVLRSTLVAPLLVIDNDSGIGASTSTFATGGVNNTTTVTNASTVVDGCSLTHLRFPTLTPKQLDLIHQRQIALINRGVTVIGYADPVDDTNTETDKPVSDDSGGRGRVPDNDSGHDTQQVNGKPEMHWVGLVSRGGCPFDEKVYFLQEAGLGTVVVYNNGTATKPGSTSTTTSSSSSAFSKLGSLFKSQAEVPIRMSAYSMQALINVYAMFLNHADGVELIAHARALPKDEVLIVELTAMEPGFGYGSHYGYHRVASMNTQQQTSTTGTNSRTGGVGTASYDTTHADFSDDTIVSILTALFIDVVFLFVYVTIIGGCFVTLCLLLSFARNMVLFRRPYVLETLAEGVHLIVIYAGFSLVPGHRGRRGGHHHHQQQQHQHRHNHRHDDQHVGWTAFGYILGLGDDTDDDIEAEWEEWMRSGILGTVGTVPGGGILGGVFGPGLSNNPPRLKTVPFPVRVLTAEDVAAMRGRAAACMGTRHTAAVGVGHINRSSTPLLPSTITDIQAVSDTDNCHGSVGVPITRVQSPQAIGWNEGGHGVAGDCCAICIEDYEVGNRVRELPCRHTFHENCVDPWLLKHNRLCPICKRDVLDPGDVNGGKGDDRGDGDRRGDGGDGGRGRRGGVAAATRTVSANGHAPNTDSMQLDTIQGHRISG